ncbi:MAG: ATP-binding cassette domain-containing protein [Acidobacteria bacterium]|nr:ATP-binding cassette domain-containing protein [Acidobacteriota bacterium]
MARQGQAQISIVFAPETDMQFALLQVQSRMDRLQPTLPPQTQIVVQRFDSSLLTQSMMTIGLLGEGDVNWLREYAELNIRPEIEAVNGVVSAAPLGGQRRAIEIVLNGDAMEAYGMTSQRLRAALDQANQPRAYVSEVRDRSNAYPVSLRGQFTTLQQIRDVVIDSSIPLRLGDVAEVRGGLQRRTDLNRVNGLSAVGIRVIKEDEANLIETADAIRSAVERINVEIAPTGMELIVVSSQADLMQGALSALIKAAVIGLVLGLVVLFLFLRNLRFVSVLTVSIPASLLLTFNLMYAWDMSINVLTLCGIALAMGLLADNAIVVLESIFKHYERGCTAARAARDGTAAVSRPVIASTATTAAVFLPVLFVQSDFETILRDLSLAIMLPLSASLLVAITLVPMLGARAIASTRSAPLKTQTLLSAYMIVLKACLRHRIRVAVTVGIVFLFTAVVASALLLQQQDVSMASEFPVFVELPEGATLEATDQIVATVEAAIGQLEGIDTFQSSVQAAEASITVQLLPPDERPDGVSVRGLQRQLTAATADIDNATITYTPPAAQGGGGGGGTGLQGSGGDQSLRIRGADLGTLQMIADDLSFRLGVVDDVQPGSVRVDVDRGAPEVQIVPDSISLFDRQIELDTVLGAISDSDVEGFTTSAGYLEADGTETSIEVRPVADPETEGLEVADLRALPVATPGGESIQLTQVARVRTDEGRASIQRTDQTRRLMVSYGFLDEVQQSQPRLTAAKSAVQTVVQGMALPEGYTIETIEAANNNVYYWMMAIAALLVFMILASLFESLTSPIVALCTLPTAAIGGLGALLLAGMGLTSTAGPMALMGFIVLIGIAVNNGIILIDNIASLRRRGYRIERAVLSAGRTCVRPIVMTTATTLLGVLPLSLQLGGDFEIWPPFAMVILGGLSVSAISTLVFVPVAYMGIGQVADWLRQVGVVGLTLSLGAAAAATYGVELRYDSNFWTYLVAVPFWLAALFIVWSVQSLHRSRAAAKRPAEAIHSIRLHTLTKIYGAPGRLRREWGRFERAAMLRVQRGLDPVDRGELAQSLSWKVPLLALLVAIDLFFEDWLWIYVFGAFTCVVVAHVAWCIGYLLVPRLFGPQTEGGEEVRPGRLLRLLRWLARTSLVVGFCVYLQTRIGATSITVMTALVWFAYRGLRALADRLATGKVDLDNITGRLRRTRRLIYLVVSKLPGLGPRRPPFTALAGVSIEIRRGMFGLLGPNGAGKTTMMRIVCQVLESTHGSVSVNGRNMKDYGYRHGVIGYLPQRFGLYDHMTARDYLDYRALLEGFRAGDERKERVDWCLEQVHLTDRQHDLIGSFSGGMKQRVGIAQTLIHAPAVVVVDEPTAGLDPVERIRFRNLLARLSQDRIVIFSTHIVEDIAGSCNQLAVLEQGQLRYSGDPEAMRVLAEGLVWEVLVDIDELDALEERHRVVNQLRTQDGIRARFLAADASDTPDAEPVRATLEDAYVHLLDQHRAMA